MYSLVTIFFPSILVNAGTHNKFSPIFFFGFAKPGRILMNDLYLTLILHVPTIYVEFIEIQKKQVKSSHC